MEIEPRIVKTLIETKFQDLPSQAVEAAKKSIIDTIGVIVAGRKAPGCEPLFRLVKDWGGKKESTVLTWALKVPFPNAVLVNGVMARALDLDEVHDIGTVHPSACVIPSTLAAAEAIGGASGKELILASTLGIDLICRMSLAPEIGACVSGMNFSYQCGTFGSAAAVGKVLRLNANQMSHALGLAYSQAAGNSQCYIDGSLTIRVQQGLSAKAGVVSALMAQRGITGAEKFFQGKFGYFNSYHGGKYNGDVLLNDLGKHFEGVNVSQKPLYACCKFTHGSIEAAKAIARDPGIALDRIRQIRATVTCQDAYNLICDPMEVKQNPRNIVDAQFSLPYTVAVALIKGEVELDDFTPKAIRNRDVLAMAQKVEVEFKPDGDRAVLPAPGIIRVETVEGKEFYQEVRFVKGHPRNPNSVNDCLEKMRACVEYSGEKKILRNFQKLADLLLDLEKVRDVRPLIGILSGQPGGKKK